jgi:hypothetical protein
MYGRGEWVKESEYCTLLTSQSVLGSASTRAVVAYYREDKHRKDVINLE